MLAARADTIVLKSGRRIAAPSVIEENGRVSYETRAGRLSLPKSVVDHIELGGASYEESAVPERAAELVLNPPAVEPAHEYDDVAGAAIHDGSIDRDYIAKLEESASGGSAAAVARVVAAHRAAALFELSRSNTEQALVHYHRSLTFAPQQASLLLNAAYLHLRRSEYTSALDYLERARRVAPDSADVAKLTGWAYYGLNKIDQAVKEWRRAQRIRPDAEVAQALKKAKRDQQTEASYRQSESAHFVLRYDGGAAPALAREVLRVLEEHFRAIESDLNFAPPEPIGVILYTHQAFFDVTRAPAWSGAINDGRIRVPVQGLSRVDDELSRILRHELTHSFIQQKTRGHCPVWLQEGVAQWMEGRRSGENAGVLVAAYESHRAVPLAALEGSWMRMPAEVATYGYARSLGVVEYLVSRYGRGDLEQLLDRIATDGSAEAAARSALHMDYSELEQETAKFLRRAYLR